jgi:PHD/YefM family antitoxin component YafN of YafNO toxin-antitoxin module
MLRPEDVRSLTDFKRNTLAQLKELKKSGRPRLLTTNGRAQVVVQDAAAYQKLLDELDRAQAVAGIQRGRADIAAGRTMPADKAFASIRRRKPR